MTIPVKAIKPPIPCLIPGFSLAFSVNSKKIREKNMLVEKIGAALTAGRKLKEAYLNN